MNGRILLFGFFLMGILEIQAQIIPVERKDTAINNLVLPKGYKASAYGAVPEFRKQGKGKKNLILIPGLGFEGTVFDDFAQANRKKYTLYILTIPGFGQTASAPMPPAGTSYGDQYWNKGVLTGIANLIESEKIRDPIIIGSFVQGTQLALRMAIDYPGKISKVIVMGGAAKFVYIDKGVPKQYPLKSMIAYTDKVTREQWFKHMPSKDFNEGNYLPEIYSLNPTRGKMLWDQPAQVPTAVMVQYVCEFFASDIMLELDRIKCPVLVLRPSFSSAVLGETINSYVKPQFIDAWNGADTANPLIRIKDIPDAASFVWKDNPSATYEAIDAFLK